MRSEVTLGEACSLIVDCPHKTAPESETPYAYAVGTKAILDGRIVLSGARPVDATTYAEWVDRATPGPGDLILCREAPVGPAALVPETPLICLGQRTVLLRPDPKVVCSRYLLYALLAPDSQAALRQLSEGSTVAHLNVASIHTFSLSLPMLAQQERIAAVLGALDDKIDSNRRLAALLEDTAETLFRARFVDFVGVEEFEDSEIGLIPRGWRLDALGEVTALITRGRAPAYVEDSGVIVVNQKCIRDLRISFELSRRNDETTRSSADRRLRVGDVLVNSTGVGTLGRVAQVRWLPGDATVDGHVTMIRANEERLLQDYMAVNLMQRLADLERLAQGSTGQTELSRARLAQLAIVVPPMEEQRSFAGFYHPLRGKIAQLEQESVTLTHLRDSLLPKLISGEIRVPDTADLTEMLEPAAKELAAAS